MPGTTECRLLLMDGLKVQVCMTQVVFVPPCTTFLSHLLDLTAMHVFKDKVQCASNAEAHSDVENIPSVCFCAEGVSSLLFLVALEKIEADSSALHVICVLHVIREIRYLGHAWMTMDD